MPGLDLTLTDCPDAALREVVLAGLIRENESRAGPSRWRSLEVVLRDDGGQITGGLIGGTAYDWLHVELLFVPEPMRGQGAGTRLLLVAEDEARARGCRGVWLDTFEFQARRFYERLGYQVVGLIADHPAGSARYFMSKRLDAR